MSTATSSTRSRGRNGDPADRHSPTIPVVATATPSPTPNPEALRFALDVKLPAGVTATSDEEAAGHPFTAAVFATGKVAQVFGMNDFVTVTRKPGEDWDEIVPAVQEAAEAHL